MAETIILGLFMLMIFLIVAVVVGYHFKWNYLSLFLGVTIVSFSSFFFPQFNYTWTEWMLDNLIGWSILGVAYIILFGIQKLTTR